MAGWHWGRNPFSPTSYLRVLQPETTLTRGLLLEIELHWGPENKKKSQMRWPGDTLPQFLGGK
jgi:hypothetical protein